ncbi:MAG: FG-GAP repeat domain-containing protein [Armatimonadota bacterium]
MRPIFRFLAALALTAVLSLQPACAQQMLRILERGPVGYLHGHTLLQSSGNLTAGDFAHPAVADWDGDGVADLICGSGYGDLLVFERRGSGPFGPARALLPADGVGLGAQPERLQVSPWLGELRPGEGLSMLLGMGDRVYRYAVRDGSTVGGRLIAGAGTAVALPGPLAPCAADLDGTGEAQVLVVDGEGRVHRLTESAAEPLMVAGSPLQVAPPARAWAGRWDDDELADLVIGTGEGRVLLFRGEGSGVFGAPEELIPEAEASGLEAAPWAADWDGDGGLDLLVGWRSGLVTLHPREGEGLAAASFIQQTDAPVDAGRCAVASAGDWNGNGLQDLVVGGEDGQVSLYLRLPGEGLRFERGLRVAGSDGPVMAPGSGALRYAAPALTDWDADGDLDLLLGGVNGRVLLWRNNGGLHPMGPLQVGGADLRVVGIAMPAPFDYNGDGDVDLFVGARPVPERPAEPGLMIPSIPPGCAYFENTVDRTHALPVFAKGVPVGITLVSRDGELRRDASFMGPYAMYPARWAGALDFITVTLQGTFRFSNTAGRGAYARLAAETEGRALPTALLPPLFSATPARLDGEIGLLAADTAYGFVTWYTRSELEG